MTARSREGEAFYAARDQRTAEYGAHEAALLAPLVVSVDVATAGSRSGQVAVMALVDMLYRVHRSVRLELPDVTTQSGEKLEALALRAALAIDPFQDPLRARVDGEFRIAVSAKPDVPGADIIATWSGGRGEVHVDGEAPPTCHHLEDGVQGGDILGAATAACLAAAAAFALAHNRVPRSTALNLLSRTSDAAASSASVVGPIDVGDVDIVGGGAVGHALTYWANEFGAVGRWNVIDGDDCEIHNTNRCMGMTVADAGWSNGIPGGVPRPKAETAARNVSATFETQWFDQVARDCPRVDLTLVLANERDVRAALAQQGDPLLLHATTSPDWTAELHRHVPGRDDCPACRLPTTTRATFRCSEGPVDPTDETYGDAALPFLSAAAGLALAVALLDLGTDGRLLEGRDNHWRFHLELPEGDSVQTMIHRGADCPHHLPAVARMAIQADDPRRWDQVDD